MSVSLDINSQATGQFSTIQTLQQMAIAETGESIPNVVLLQEPLRFLIYANKVVAEVNRHPYFRDLIANRFEDTTGSIIADSNELTMLDKAIAEGTPLVVTGAAYGGGDLHTVALGYSGNTTFLEDVAEVAVTNTPVKSPYKHNIPRYKTATDVRPINDMVMMAGIKYYFLFDDEDASTQSQIQLAQGYYYQELNQWMSGMIGGYSALYVSIREDS